MDDEAVLAPAEPTVSLDVPVLADEPGAGPVLLAEWALWGKEEQRASLHVLRCSKGTLTGDDFTEIFTRYATGVKEWLPQYTVCWIPADGRRHPAYLAVGIHELADPRRSDGRSPYVGGREVEYVRLFCFRYDDVADLGLSYTDLLTAVRGERLRPGQVEPARFPVPAVADTPASAGPVRGLAPLVASLLLTRQPVCVLDADLVDVDARLAFIDDVLSLLPFGLRATLSGSTWASPTAADLKLRLFFSTARRASDARTYHVSWVHPDQVPPGQPQAADFYREWLREASAPAIANLSRMTRPARFSEAEISQLLTELPRNKSLAETFAELSASLRAGDQRAVSVALKPLKLALKRTVAPADREAYRALVEKHQLLAGFPGLHYSTQASLYTTLLRLAYGNEVAYDSYCGIERAAGARFGARLQNVLLGSRTLTILPLILTARKVPGRADEEVMAAMAAQGFGPGYLLDKLERQAGQIAPQHLLVLDDFAVRYLLSEGEDVAGQLISRGYMSGFFARAYPPHERAYADVHQRKLASILRIVYGDAELTPRQVAEIFAQPDLDTAGPVEDVVKTMTPRRLWRFVEQEAIYARMTREGRGADVEKLRQAARRRAPWPGPGRPRARARRRGAPLVPRQAVNVAVIAGGMALVFAVVFVIMRAFSG